LSEGLNNHQAFSAEVTLSSTAALQKVVEQSVDLVIVDMSIKDVSPPKLIKAIREAKSSLPIMVTPVIGQDVPENVKSLDIQGILPKPFFIGDLPKIVGGALGLDLDSQVPDLPAQPARNSNTRRSSPTPAAEKPVEAPQPVAKVETAPAPVAAATTEIYLPTLEARKLERLRKHREDIVNQLKDMNSDFRAEVILLTAGSELIAKAGTMSDKRADELAMLVAKSAETISQMARFLGERTKNFEQSMHEGSRFRLYSYSLGEGVVLSMALDVSVPLGIIRHQTRRTCQQLIKDYIR
jgi:DNA-binding response OmpR family regulator